MTNKKNRRGRLQIPILRSVQKINKKGVAAFRQAFEKPPEVKNQNPKGTRQLRTTRGSGFTTEAQVKPHPKQKGVQVHDLAIDRQVNQQRETPFKRPNVQGQTPQGKELRQARAMAAWARGLDQVPVGSQVQGEYYSADGNQGARAKFFGKGTNGLAIPDDRGFFGATRDGQNSWTRQDGAKIRFNPNQAKANLARLAIERTAALAGGPVTQGVLQLDNLVKMTTGKSILDEVGKAHLRQQQQSIQNQSQPGLGIFQSHAGWGTNTPF